MNCEFDAAKAARNLDKHGVALSDAEQFEWETAMVLEDTRKPYAALAAMKRPRGRPKIEETKVFTAIRLDADLLDAFKATGKGWQTRINAALPRYIEEHPFVS